MHPFPYVMRINSLLPHCRHTHTLLVPLLLCFLVREAALLPNLRPPPKKKGLVTFSKTRAHTGRLFRVGSSQISLLFAAECCSRPGHPPPHSGQSAIHTVSPFIGTNLLKAASAFITCQATQVQRSNFALFVFALSLDYCVFVALLNRFTIQRLHLDLGIHLFFPCSRIQEGTPAHLYLASVMALATC